MKYLSLWLMCAFILAPFTKILHADEQTTQTSDRTELHSFCQMSTLEELAIANHILARAYEKQGDTAFEKKEFTAALESYKKAVKLDPFSTDIYKKIGKTQSALNLLDDAIISFKKAFELNQTAYTTLLELGNTLNMANRPEEALPCYEKLLKKFPHEETILYNYGYTLKRCGNIKKAIALYEQLRTDFPSFTQTNFSLGLAYLSVGDFERGLPYYEWRWNAYGETPSQHSSPVWDGSDPRNKTILLVSEQGLGDTFQFIRYGKLLKAQGARVIAQVQKPLKTLLSLCPYLDSVVTGGDSVPHIDAHIALMSLPLAFKTTLTTIPNETPYLFARQDLVDYWHSYFAHSAFAQEELQHDSNNELQSTTEKRLARNFRAQPKRNFKVGLCWQGNAGYSTQYLRNAVAAKSMTLEQFAPLAALPGVELYNLQKISGTDQAHSFTLHTFDDIDTTNGRFMDTAAIIKNLDLVITIDTSIAHLAAGLGVATWNLLPEPADWRWMTGTAIHHIMHHEYGFDLEGSPWYPTMRLFRQPKSGDWTSMINHVCAVLTNVIREQTTSEQTTSEQTTSEKTPPKALSYTELFKSAKEAIELKDYPESIALYDRAIALDPQRVEALFNCGIIHLRLTPPDNEKALSYFDRAVIVAPTHAKSLRYRAKCLAALGKKEEALTAYEKALPYNTSSSEIYTEYAQVCSDKADYTRAAELYESAYKLNPTDQTLLSLGNSYNMLNDLDKALSWYKKLEEKNPTSAAVIYNIAYTYKKLGRMDEAFPYYQKVLALEPEHPDAHFGLGLSYLITGDFENGFREYEWRWARDKKKKTDSLKTPAWDGCANLEGSTFLLVAEQGLGDTFQFIRYGKVLHEHYGVARVIAVVQKPLVQLLSLCPYLDQVVAIGSPFPAHDYYAYTVSMPNLCKTTRTTTPTPIPYLHAREDLVEFWHEKLATDKNFKVGICWQGNPNYSTQFLRSVVAAKSITLTKLLPLFNVPGVSFYNLQKMTGEEQLKLLPEGTPLISFGEDFDKDHGRFMDTAAVMKNLDLMITVDTGTAHLAAGLGVPTWTFIPEPPDWRWMLKCDDTPWYPNMRLFRQPSIGDWETTIATVCSELEKLVHEKQVHA